MGITSIRLFAGSAGLAAVLAATFAYQAAASTASPSPKQGQAAPAAAPKADGSYVFPAIGTITPYRAKGQVKGVALFLSGDGGWNLGVVDMARAMAERGVTVAGISTPAFQKALERGQKDCINPNYALTELAQDFEHRMGLPRYVKPILIGYSSGATMAYSALAQAPAGVYRASVSLGFGPDIGGKKPWCPIPGVTVTRITKPESGWLFSAAPRLSAPWIVLQGLADQVVSPETTRAFTAHIPQAELIELPKVGHGFSVQANWMPQFTQAIDKLFAQPRQAAPQGHAPASAFSATDDLPLTEVTDPHAPHSRTMAVLYSGDGGWAGLDRDLAARLAAHGVPVVGVDSLQYFWTARSPHGAAADAARIIASYSQKWNRPRVLLLGYSFGADNLPYIVGSLPAAQQRQLARVSMLGLSPTADFQFHLASWLDVGGDRSMPTVPQLSRLRGLPLQCIRGTDEHRSACLALPAGLADQVVMPGGHHFGGNADLLASAILKGLAT